MYKTFFRAHCKTVRLYKIALLRSFNLSFGTTIFRLPSWVGRRHGCTGSFAALPKYRQNHRFCEGGKFYNGLFIFACLWGVLWGGGLQGAEPSALYLTWVHDPTSTMTIQWHTPSAEKASVIYYRKQGEKAWSPEEGKVVPLDGSKVAVHTVELTALEEDTDYVFRIGGNESIYRFRTLPATQKRSLRFAVGGDIFFSSYLFRKMNRTIAQKDPDFVVLGGDIAYTLGQGIYVKNRSKAWQIKRWQAFFQEWKKEMVTTDGRLIPMLVVVGNHDVECSKQEKTCESAALFFDLFALPENRSYHTLDVGNYLSLFLLDTGHLVPMEGKQATWLEESLQARDQVLYKMAAYHVAAYPSVYKYTSKGPKQVRRFFCPLFEQYHVQGAFEHHNHAFKRTAPMLNEKVDAQGVIYFGDGAWGVPARKIVPMEQRWYLEKAGRLNCFWLVSVGKEEAVVEAFGIKGNSLDRVSLTPHQQEAKAAS